MATMKDVAKMVGVSQATISYAYSRPHKISTVRREIIMKAAEDLGYPGPHIAGQLLKSGRIGAAGLMVTGSLSYAITDPSAQMVLKGIAEVGDFRNIPLTIFPLQENQVPESVQDKEKVPIPAASPVLRGLVDGLVVYAVPEDNGLFHDVLRKRLPVVAIDGPIVHGVPHVAIDDQRASAELMRFALQFGHRNIAIILDRLTRSEGAHFIEADQLHNSPYNVSRNRLRGYCNAIDGHDIDLGSITIADAGGFDRNHARSAIDLVLEKTIPTLVVCMTDVQAIWVGRRLQERGFNIPEDISLVGFDDNPSAEDFGLTTVRQPMIEKGHVAAQMLMDLLTGTKPKNNFLRTELIVRSSIGPCKP